MTLVVEAKGAWVELGEIGHLPLGLTYDVDCLIAVHGNCEFPRKVGESVKQFVE